MTRLVSILAIVLLASLAQAGPPHPMHSVAGPQYGHDHHPHPRQRLARWYAGESMRQNEEARQMVCGFTGQRWALDWDMHYRWALRANPNRVYREIDQRDRHLARCRARKLREHRQPPPGRPYK